MSPVSLAVGFACASAGVTKPVIIREQEADIRDRRPELTRRGGGIVGSVPSVTVILWVLRANRLRLGCSLSILFPAV
jgi:hypothetical protein